MEIELQEIRDFLAEHPPFDGLPAEQLDELPRQITIRYLRRGDHIASDSALLYLVRSGSLDVRDERDNLIDKLDEGELCQLRCDNQLFPGHIIASADTLVYTLACEQLQQLRSRYAEFDQYFSAAFSQPDSATSNLVEIRQLLTRAPVTLSAENTIQQAAQHMREQNVSSLIIMDQETPTGILTDKDLRNRCLAEGLDSQQPVSTIMSQPVTTLPGDTLADDAILAMTRRQIHHIPVVEQDKLLGMLTVTDLLKAHNTNSALFIRDIHNADTVEQLAALSARLPELQLQLANQNHTARHIGQAISHITDAITQQLLLLAEQQMGPAPAPYVWVAGGSQARQEQTSHSDQDNALILANGAGAQQDDYFDALARYVSDGLNACGYVYCPGNAMATNPEWRLRLADWQAKFSRWIERPEPKSLMYASIFFDLRPVHGDTSLFEELQRDMLRQTEDNKLFIAYLAAHAVKHRPPLGIFRNLVLIHEGEHKDRLDLKHRGIVPIIDIARLLALACGSGETHTGRRLAAVHAAGQLSEAMYADLLDAMEFIAGLRIEHQARQIRAGLAPDNYLDPHQLSGLERQHLKNAFRVIKDMQETLETRYQTGRFG